MNIYQKRVLIAVMVVIVVMLFFPPMEGVTKQGTVVNIGYGEIFDTSAKFVPRVGTVVPRVNIKMLLTQWIGVLLVGGIGFFIAQGSAQKSSNSRANSSIKKRLPAMRDNIGDSVPQPEEKIDRKPDSKSEKEIFFTSQDISHDSIMPPKAKTKDELHLKKESCSKNGKGEVAVKNGFNWWALLWPHFWAIYHGFLFRGSIAFALPFAVTFSGYYFLSAMVSCGFSILYGLEGNNWVRSKLQKKGYTIVESGSVSIEGKDKNHRIKTLQAAAEQGNAEAQNNLGVAYEFGQSVPKDYLQAAKWYRLSAEQGYSTAQNNLGMMYESGEGVPKDYIQAHQWYSLSSAQSNVRARNKLRFLESQMTPDQIAEAKKLINGLMQKNVSRQDDDIYMELFERYQKEKPPPPSGLKPPQDFGYIKFKAYSYLKMGPEFYSRNDALGMPPEKASSHTLDLVEQGCKQILEWRGIAPERPLEGIGINGFYRLIELFHFKVVEQKAIPEADGTFLDEMLIKHVVSGEEMTLFNKVKHEFLVASKTVEG